MTVPRSARVTIPGVLTVESTPAACARHVLDPAHTVTVASKLRALTEEPAR